MEDICSIIIDKRKEDYPELYRFLGQLCVHSHLVVVCHTPCSSIFCSKRNQATSFPSVQESEQYVQSRKLQWSVDLRTRQGIAKACCHLSSLFCYIDLCIYSYLLKFLHVCILLSFSLAGHSLPRWPLPPSLFIQTAKDSR